VVGDGASRDFERVNERSVDARFSLGIFEPKPAAQTALGAAFRFFSTLLCHCGDKKRG
jgi:hypothetical protein